MIKLLALLLFVISTSSCVDTIDKMRRIGKQPELNSLENPLMDPMHKPVRWHEDERDISHEKRSANSLWTPGARTFFRDQRARRVGDIVKVTINIADKADMNNKTDAKRNNTDNVGITGVFGLESRIPGWLPGSKEANAANLGDLVNVTGKNNHAGEGKIARNENIQTQVAAIVTQILPNGNLVIKGRQEVRVNYELREITVEGIARVEDISSENSISSDQIAEARISYGGRGHITDVQQPRWGSQVIDAISPF